MLFRVFHQTVWFWNPYDRVSISEEYSNMSNIFTKKKSTSISFMIEKRSLSIQYCSEYVVDPRSYHHCLSVNICSLLNEIAKIIRTLKNSSSDLVLIRIIFVDVYHSFMSVDLHSQILKAKYLKIIVLMIISVSIVHLQNTRIICFCNLKRRHLHHTNICQVDDWK